MALRKFTFISTEGFSEEQAPTDEINLGKLTLSGLSGIAIDGGATRAVNFADPTAATDLTTKQYVDGVAAGLDWKESVRLATAAALPSYTASGAGVGKTLTATANGALSVDSVAVVVGNRILVKDEGAGTSAHNGIYVVTAVGDGSNPYILTRATDADQASEVDAGMAMFVEEGTVNLDTGWLLITNNAIVVDTTPLTFSQFTGLGSIIAGAGLLKSGSTIDVELDTAANAQGAGTGGGSSGLEFDTSGVAGKLRAAVNATGGLERTASGLAVRIDDTPDTLDADADGLKVVGLPSLFKINGTNVGATVTAANLDTLTNGSNAETLHTHDKVKRIQDAHVTSENLTAGDPVAWSTTANQVQKGDASVDAESRIVGLTLNTVAAAGTANIVKVGVAAGVLSGATANTPYYLASGGGLTTTAPGANNRVILIGYAINATDLDVRITDYGKKS